MTITYIPPVNAKKYVPTVLINLAIAYLAHPYKTFALSSFCVLVGLFVIRNSANFKKQDYKQIEENAVYFGIVIFTNYIAPYLFPFLA